MDASASPTTYVALLRGINVGGRNVIKMADLRATFDQLGFADVRTHIQSGNVIFRSSSADAVANEAAIEAALTRAHRYEARVVLRSLAEYGAMLAAFPTGWGSDPARKHHVIFLRAAIDRESLIDELGPRQGIDEVLYLRGALLWSVDAATQSRSTMIKLSGRPAYREMTIRNLNTTTKLFALMQALDPGVKTMSDPTQLGVIEAATLLQTGALSASELTATCLARIRTCDGTHSHDGDPESINAWVRVYEEEAVAAAARADERLTAAAVKRDGAPPPLTGIPVGLKDLFSVAGKPITASSRALDDVATEDCDVWKQLEAAGMVLVGHLHTHEFAAGGTTDQVGSPWDLARSSGGSSGGSAAAVAARMVPAATGTDTAGSLRIPSACCGTSTIKPTHGLVSMAGVVPLSTSLDHAGPIARSLEDCRALLAAMARPERPSPIETLGPLEGSKPLAGVRVAVSPRVAGAELDVDVAAGFERGLEACRELGAVIVSPPPPEVNIDVGEDFLDVLTTDMRAYHRRFDAVRELYRPSTREWVETGERRAVSAEGYRDAQARRAQQTSAWVEWLDLHRVTAMLEPTIPVVAPLRGEGYDHAGSDYALISLTHLWDWTGLPVAALPSGVGGCGLPVGVSLIGRLDADWDLLSLGTVLQSALGVPDPYRTDV